MADKNKNEYTDINSSSRQISSSGIYETLDVVFPKKVHDFKTVNKVEEKWKFDWIIPFLKLREKKDIQGVRTQNIVEVPPGEIKIQLQMKFLGKHRELIEIYCLLPTPLSFQLETCSSCTSRSSNRWANISNEHMYKAEANKWLYLTTLFVKRDNTLMDILAQNVSDLEDGSLYLRFEFNVSSTPEVNQCSVPITQKSSDFENLLREGIFADVVLKSDDNKEFKTHKAILSSRCSVLKANFEHNTTETVTNIVESPFESEVLQEIIFFIYTERVSKIDEIPEKLLVAADYYQLNELKKLCEDELHKKLSIENAVETLQLADRYSASTLKQNILNFIKDEDEQLTLISLTEGWMKVKSADLFKQICEHCCRAVEYKPRPRRPR